MDQDSTLAWTIHSWSPDAGTGEIRSPHFAPIPFGAAENVTRTHDFEIGEAVFVELDSGPSGFSVRKLWPARQRQPEGTRYPAFDAVNGRYGDLRVEKATPSSVRFWLGDCCEWCCPNASRVTFEGIACVEGIVDDWEGYAATNPLLRLASAAEVADRGLTVPEGTRAFCIVDDHGNGFDGDRILIVARLAIVDAASDPSPKRDHRTGP